MPDLIEFRDKVLYVLNQMPLTDRPPDRLLGKWLFERLKPARCLERWIERIRDCRENSKRRTFQFLWDRLEIAIKESRHEANAKSVSAALKSGPKPKGPAPAEKAGGAAAPEVVPEPPLPKHKRDPATNNMTPAEKLGHPCAFLVRGSCNRGADCVFSHDDALIAKAKAAAVSAKGKPKGPPPKATAAADPGVSAVVSSLLIGDDVEVKEPSASVPGGVAAVIARAGVLRADVLEHPDLKDEPEEMIQERMAAIASSYEFVMSAGD
jgi:hypothetical protein